MITITQEQMAALGQTMRERFEMRMVAHLRQAFPAMTAGREQPLLLEFVRAGMACAHPYGVVFEYDLQRYLDYMMIYGHDFDLRPDCAWAGTILNAPDMTGSQKMDQMDDYDMFVMNRPS
jgi:hypothetical protein